MGNNLWARSATESEAGDKALIFINGIFVNIGDADDLARPLRIASLPPCPKTFRVGMRLISMATGIACFTGTEWAPASPFARPHFDEIIGAIDFVIKNDYPGRGEYTGEL